MFCSIAIDSFAGPLARMTAMEDARVEAELAQRQVDNDFRKLDLELRREELAARRRETEQRAQESETRNAEFREMILALARK